MFKRHLLAASLLGMSGVSSVHALPYGFFDARSVAMGNVSVATGNITTAALSNPGMLAVNEQDDTVAVIAGIGFQAIDDGDMIDKVDDYQDLGDSPAEILEKIEIIQSLEDDSVIVAAIPNVAMVYSGDDITMGVTLRANAVATAQLNNISTVLTSPDDVEVDALYVLTTEVGVPIGTSFDLAGMDLSVGVTPRFVQVEGIDIRESIATIDIEEIIDDYDEEDLGDFTTFDAGVTLNVFDTFRIGVVAKNLVEETKTTSTGRDIDFDTHVRAGAAFDAGFMTIAADMDLTEREAIGGENDSQVLAIGAEFDTFSVMQLRAGYQTNTVSGATDPDLYSLGFGFWFGFHLDIALVAGDDSSFGAYAQSGFHF